MHLEIQKGCFIGPFFVFGVHSAHTMRHSALNRPREGNIPETAPALPLYAYTLLNKLYWNVHCTLHTIQHCILYSTHHTAQYTAFYTLCCHYTTWSTIQLISVNLSVILYLIAQNTTMYSVHYTATHCAVQLSPYAGPFLSSSLEARPRNATR